MYKASNGAELLITKMNTQPFRTITKFTVELKSGDWPDKEEILKACNGGRRAWFGGRVKYHGDLAFVELCLD